MKLVALDRAGVLNHESPDFLKSPEEWLPIKGSLEAIARLSQAGYDVIVITNQSGVARGLLSADMLGQIHVRMIDYVQQHGGKIQSVLFCPHHPDDDCECRKPKTGLYQDLARRLNIAFTDVFSVGDSLRDLQAAAGAGAKPILVRTGNGRHTQQSLSEPENEALQSTPVFQDLAKFVDALLMGKLS